MLIATDDELDCPDDKLLDAHNHRYGCNLMHRIMYSLETNLKPMRRAAPSSRHIHVLFNRNLPIQLYTH